jgi:multidrug efflux pump subunit AcrA (membrane-fusion protein)
MPAVGFRSRLRERTPAADLAAGRDRDGVAARVTPPWVKYALVAACIAAIAGAAVAVGPGGQSAARSRIVTAQRGVVQATVSGTGTVQGASQESVNFKTGGQLRDVFVKVGQHVGAGQVLAEIDPTQATLSLNQAEANLSSAEARLAQAETPGGASASNGASSGGTSTNASGTAPAAFVQTAAARPQRSARKRPSGSQKSGSRTTTSPSAPQSAAQPGGGSASGQSAEATAAAIAAARAGVDSAEAAVASAQQMVNDTKLVAPVAGTVASISAQPGETVGGGGSSALQAGGSGSSGASSSAAGGQGGGGQGAASGSGASASSSAPSSGFIVLVDTTSFELQVPISESDISKLHVGQPATVTVNALPGEQTAAHVTSIDSLPTTNSGVVSYNVDFSLDQPDPGLRPGMTASAQVVVSQVSGVVSVPTAAISRRGGAQTVMLVRGGKTVTQPIVTGLAGDNATQVISGVNAGDRIAIPVVSAAAGTASRGFGGGLGGGGGFGFGGGGGAAGRLGGGGRFGGGG